MSNRTLSLAIVIGLVAVACVPTDTEPPSTTSEGATTTNAPSSTTDPPDRSGSSKDHLEPPERGDPSDVAADAFWAAGDFEIVGEATLIERDALEAIKRWLPEDLIDGIVWDVFSQGDDTNVLVVSVIPTLTWRGDPKFVPSLIATLTDADAHEISPDIYEAETSGGLILYAQSTGDGFVISTSLKPESAVTYLEALSAESRTQEVWEPGSCLYIDPEVETLPYAPFPPDIVVPCNGPHNTEVLVSRQIGTNLTEYDDQAIDYDRNYECDKAYAEEFGPQKTRKPTLITYMPDEDEWMRGDRYLACVVQLETTDGIELIAGAMADVPNLVWSPEPGTCLGRSFAPDAVACSSIHGYQYLGDADVSLDEWPTERGAAFKDACADLLAEFVRQGPAKIEIFATGLFPYAFEQGDRTVRCMAFAVEDGLLVEVVGSFDDIWRVVGSGGLAA